MASYILELLYAPLSPQKALDKLTSRLGSPSPARSNTPASRLHPDHARSGSETERESTHTSSSHKHSVSMSSYSSSTTSPAASSQALDSPYSRLRHLSAPGSPNKARAAAAGSTHTSTSSGSSHSPSRRRRHRSSMASMSQLQLSNFSEEEDEEPGLRTATNTARDRASRDRTLNERDLITQSALAAVASSRRSPLGSRRRAALPKEFRSDLMDDSPSGGGRHTVAGRYDSRRESSESWKVRNPHICYVFTLFITSI
jgi:hypothetical protein